MTVRLLAVHLAQDCSLLLFCVFFTFVCLVHPLLNIVILLVIKECSSSGHVVATAPSTAAEKTHIAAFDRLPRAHARTCGSIVALQFAKPQTSAQCHKFVTCFHCSFRRVRLLSIASIVSIAIMSTVTVIAVAYLRTIGSRSSTSNSQFALMCGCSPATASLVTCC